MKHIVQEIQYIIKSTKSPVPLITLLNCSSSDIPPINTTKIKLIIKFFLFIFSHTLISAQ